MRRTLTHALLPVSIGIIGTNSVTERDCQIRKVYHGDSDAGREFYSHTLQLFNGHELFVKAEGCLQSFEQGTLSKCLLSPSIFPKRSFKHMNDLLSSQISDDRDHHHMPKIHLVAIGQGGAWA
jgi:hypothetical protein